MCIRDSRNYLPRLQIEHRHRPRPDVGGVPAPAIVRDRQHVRFRLPGGNRTHNLERLGIDDRDGLFQFRSDVEHSGFRMEHGEVRPHAFSEIDIPRDLAGSDIDHHHAGAVGSRLSDAGVSINRNVGRLPVGRCRHLMSGNATFGHGGHLLAQFDIDDAQTMVALIGHQQQTSTRRFRDCGRQATENRNHQT